MSKVRSNGPTRAIVNAKLETNFVFYRHRAYSALHLKNHSYHFAVQNRLIYCVAPDFKGDFLPTVHTAPPYWPVVKSV